MIYLCENKDCQCKMEDVFVSMAVEQPSCVFPGKKERREFAFCSRGCFVKFCCEIDYRGSPMRVEYPLGPWT